MATQKQKSQTPLSSKTEKNAYEAEQAIIKEYKEYIYQGDKIMHAGNTELFTKDILT